MSTLGKVLLVIMILLVVAIVVLYFLGKRMEKKQAESAQAIEAAKQTCTMLVIDKQKKRMKESGLPQMVIDQTPWYLKRSKVPIVKCKVGPQIVTMIADENVFDIIPVKQTVKATVSGIYITDVRGLRGPLPKPEPKKGLRAKFLKWYDGLRKSSTEEAAASSKKKKK